MNNVFKKVINIGIVGVFVLMALLVMINVQEEAEAGMTTSMKALYRLDTNANDYSGNAIHGTTYDVSYSSNAQNYRSAYFDGNDYIDCGGSSHFSMTSLSISVWVKVSSYSESQQYIVAKGQAPDWQYGLRIVNGKIYGHIWKYYGSAHASAYSSSAISTGEWHHISMTWDGHYLRLYIDGDQVDYDYEWRTTGQCVSSNGNLYVGRRSDGNYFTGYLDDVVIYSRSLSSSEVEELADSLIGYYKFEGNTNDRSYFDTDLTTNGVIDYWTYQGLDGYYADFYDEQEEEYAYARGGGAEYVSQSMTISFWVYSSTMSGTQYICGKGQTGLWQYGIRMSNGDIGAHIWTSGGSNHATCASTYDIDDSDWHHVAITWQPGSALKIYIDGSYNAQDTSFYGSPCVTQTYDLYIGKRVDGYNFEGYLDEFSFYASVLDSSEIYDLYDEYN